MPLSDVCILAACCCCCFLRRSWPSQSSFLAGFFEPAAAAAPAHSREPGPVYAAANGLQACRWLLSPARSGV